MTEWEVLLNFSLLAISWLVFRAISFSHQQNERFLRCISWFYLFDCIYLMTVVYVPLQILRRGI